MSLLPSLHTSLPPLPLPTKTHTQSLLARTPNPSRQTVLPILKSQILTGDYTTPSFLDPSSAGAFPENLLTTTTTAGAGVDVAETRLPTDVHCQVLNIEDLSRSRWDQIEELERIERGEMQRGRAVVRVSSQNEEENHDADEGNNNQNPPGGPQQQQKSKKNATHRLTLQDHTGQTLYALELVRLPRIGVGATKIGEKVLLRKGTLVARGTVLLEPASCVFLGGQIASLERKWAGERLRALREVVGAGEGGG